MNGRAALARIYHIHREVSSGRYPNVPTLMEHLECSESTIRRDLDAMRDRLGAPLVYDRRRRGYRYEHDYRLPAVDLAMDELEAIWVARQWLRQTKGTPYEPAMQRAWDKLAALFGLDHNTLEQWSVVNIAAEPLRGSPQVLQRNYRCLESAAQNHQVVRIRYYSPRSNEQTVRTVEPIGLQITSGACYCIAFCRLRNEYRSFAVDRILEIELTGETFVPSEGFSLQAYLEGSLGVMRGELIDIELWVTEEQARYLDEQPKHPSQRRLREEHNGVVYGFRLADNLETLRWVLSLGAVATVLSPEEYACRVCQELTSALANY
ncbi:MAG: helix-turn-helix transcriptional regulator [Bacillota bacterium]|jgi:predicted DNA-binding transcriptional regulator YafY